MQNTHENYHFSQELSSEIGHNGMILHTIGDSHCLHGWKGLQVPGYEEIRCHHLGSRLMHTFAKKGADLPGARHALAEVLPGDALVFSFGEIDCRAHAHQHGVCGLAHRYVAKIVEIRDEYELLGPLVVQSVVPPQRNPAPVSAGSAEDRLGFVHSLNKDLALCAGEHGLRFLDIYTPYRDAYGFMREDLVGRRGHIGDPLPLYHAVTRILP